MSRKHIQTTKTYFGFTLIKPYLNQPPGAIIDLIYYGNLRFVIDLTPRYNLDQWVLNVKWITEKNVNITRKIIQNNSCKYVKYVINTLWLCDASQRHISWSLVQVIAYYRTTPTPNGQVITRTKVTYPGTWHTPTQLNDLQLKCIFYIFTCPYECIYGSSSVNNVYTYTICIPNSYIYIYIQTIYPCYFDKTHSTFDPTDCAKSVTCAFYLDKANSLWRHKMETFSA